ncbi:hypothetical protein Pla175_03840 [Pirellulimonas nuda]|uniref:YcxB-like C-terminal domain-containing protein n=1 Tax=Pirellulimonas nuda TaxID=2528009 RepID=A0A518D6D0_9BACT|nr:YcxB family protein [Pirellulimonas nuda]QDU87030.1 hypothetical protein Pla175_03840 [Pirellulimonas nuda]
MTEPNPYQSPAPAGAYTPPRVEAIEPPVTVRVQEDEDMIAITVDRVLKYDATYRSTVAAQRSRQLMYAFLTGAVGVAAWAPDRKSMALSVFLVGLSIRYLIGAAFTWRRLKRAITQQTIARIERCKNSPQDGAYSLTLQYEGVRIARPNVSSEMRWGYFCGVRRTDEFLFLERGEGDDITIPARAFHDEAAFEAFCDLARRLWENHRPERAMEPEASAPGVRRETPPGANASGSIQS